MAGQGTGLTKWTDTEKLALCISLINASGPPDWKKVKLPANRTKRACLHVYNSLKKQSEGIALSAPGTPAVSKRRKVGEEAGIDGGTKRKRGGKASKSTATVVKTEDEEEESDGAAEKKVKMDSAGIDGENDQNTAVDEDEEE